MHPRRLHRRRLEGQGRQWIAIRRRFVADGLIFAWKSSSWSCGILWGEPEPVGIRGPLFHLFPTFTPSRLLLRLSVRLHRSRSNTSTTNQKYRSRGLLNLLNDRYPANVTVTSRDRETQLLFPSRARGCRGSSIAVPLHFFFSNTRALLWHSRGSAKRGLQLLRVLSTYM